MEQREYSTIFLYIQKLNPILHLMCTCTILHLQVINSGSPWMLCARNGYLHKKVRSSLIHGDLRSSNVLVFDSHDGKIVLLEPPPASTPATSGLSSSRSSGGERGGPAAAARGDSSSGGGAREASGPAARGARGRRRGAREAARRLEAASSTGRPAGARLRGTRESSGGTL